MMEEWRELALNAPPLLPSQTNRVLFSESYLLEEEIKKQLVRI